MKFLTDENIYAQIVAALRAQGHDVLDIKEQALFGMQDHEIAHMAQQNKRILITSDKDFSNILAYPPNKYSGIIVLRLSRLTIQAATQRLVECLKGLKPSNVVRKLAIVEPDRVRFRG